MGSECAVAPARVLLAAGLDVPPTDPEGLAAVPDALGVQDAELVADALPLGLGEALGLSDPLALDDALTDADALADSVLEVTDDAFCCSSRM